eukprot:GDKI01041154.1.p1 GENE.GDKI01041154.1~~GDKI01041154.1.p1  ORF type:complete len:145 (-),score=28.30 GDKI01041154.1:256-690(-)
MCVMRGVCCVFNLACALGADVCVRLLRCVRLSVRAWIFVSACVPPQSVGAHGLAVTLFSNRPGGPMHANLAERSVHTYVRVSYTCALRRLFKHGAHAVDVPQKHVRVDQEPDVKYVLQNMGACHSVTGLKQTNRTVRCEFTMFA